ncbi:MAG TPA: bifunctional riboflavin kinase/FAD synthetase [Bryobacteraceae bacterium]|nr:bifunctional riboflavin kinase/FAD synthetase [Bryobacteraceae bacterium]
MPAEFRVFHSLDEVPPDFGPSVITVGNFDGVHAGHRHILRRVREIAEERKWKASVLTFDPHPTKIVAPQRAPRLMTLPEERCALIRAEGIAQVIILPFTPAVARLTPEEFVEQALVAKLGARAVVVGENFRFGHKQAGDTRLLGSLGKRFGFKVDEVPALYCRGMRVSSSAVRSMVESGAVARAARFLMHPYALAGDVVSGHGLGSRKTVPTLNLATKCEVLPKTGVYVTRTIDLDNHRGWESVTNIGYRPTFGGDDRLSIETFLLDRAVSEPPRRIRVEFLWRLREERKFESPEALKAQILKDVARTQAYFRRMRRWTRQIIFDYAKGESHETVRR